MPRSHLSTLAEGTEVDQPPWMLTASQEAEERGTVGVFTMLTPKMLELLEVMETKEGKGSHMIRINALTVEAEAIGEMHVQHPRRELVDQAVT